MSYNNIYVISLDKSQKRWKKISEILDLAGLKYQRFGATFGFDIHITNQETNQTILGKKLQDKSSRRIDADVKYTITCDPENIIPIKFNYFGDALTAGELGLWCSNIRVWHDVIKNNFEIVIVLEDDVFPIDVREFKQQLDDLTSDLPDDFDLVYMYYINYLPNSLLPKARVENNSFVKKFDSTFEARGTQAIVYSKKAVETLLSYETYTRAIDGFLWGITLNEDFTHQELPELSQGLLKIYTSASNLVGTDYSDSILAEMRA